MSKLTIKLTLAALLAVGTASPVFAQYPSEYVENSIVVTKPSNGSTVTTSFILSGTYRGDLGCNVAYLTIEGKNGLVTTAGLTTNPANNTWSWKVDATKPLTFESGGEGDAIGTGKRNFYVGSSTPNCGSGEILLTIAPKGGVATGSQSFLQDVLNSFAR